MLTQEGKALEDVLWQAAKTFKSVMAADDYKDYLLKLFFYKYLSDCTLHTFGDMLAATKGTAQADVSTTAQCQALYEKYVAEHAGQMYELEDLYCTLGYNIPPDATFEAFLAMPHLDVARLMVAFAEVERSSSGMLAGIFSDCNLDSPKLGVTYEKRERLLRNVMETMAQVDTMACDAATLGTVFDDLLAHMAASVRKMDAEFYTPREVAEVMARLVTHQQADGESFSVLDPTMGSGSLLLAAQPYIPKNKYVTYYGQELSAEAYTLARMNLIIHGLSKQVEHLHLGDTLLHDWPTGAQAKFDAVIMRPPFGMKWAADDVFLRDDRFRDFGVLPPRSKADAAFLLHGLHHLKDDGTMAIILPHGFLFRGAAEANIRQQLLERGLVDAVIGMPAGLFANTSIPTVILVLKKNRASRDVLFIDASKEVSTGRNKHLTAANIECICQAYAKRQEEQKFSHVASFEEVKENGFNLNIPRYIDTFEPEPEVKITELVQETEKISQQIQADKATLCELLQQFPVEQAAIAEERKKLLALFR